MVMRSRVTGAAQRGTGRRVEPEVEDDKVVNVPDVETEVEGAEDPDAQAGDEAGVPAGIGRRGAVRSPGANTRVPRGAAPDTDDNAEETAGPTVAKRGPKPGSTRAPRAAKAGKAVSYNSAAEVKAAMKALDGEIKSTIGAHNDRMKELRAKHAELAGHLFDHTSR